MRAGVLALFLAGGLAFGLVGCGGDPASVASKDEVARACEEDFHGCVEYGPEDPVTIGALLWLSASADPSGLDAKRGTELAVDYLDGVFDATAGEILGHPVRLGAVDDGCDQRQGRTGAEALAEVRGLLAVVGTTCSSSAIDAAAEVFSEKGITLISPSNTAPELTDPLLREEFYFRTAPNDQIQGRVVGRFGARVARGGRAVAVTDRSAYSDSLVETFSDAFGKGRVDVVRVRQTDDAAAIRQALEGEVGGPNRPGAVYFPLIGDVCTEFVRAMDPDTADSFITSDGCLNSEVLTAAGEQGIEVYASGPEVRGLDDNLFYESELLSAYRDQFGENPISVFHAHAFDAASLIFDAFRRTALIQSDGSIAVPRTAFRDAVLEVAGYQGFSGRLTCLDTGDCQERALISVYRSPAWPIEGGTENARPIYARTENLANFTVGED